MAVSININSKYNHLNADRSHTAKPGGAGVEKSMIVDIVLTAEDLSDGTAGDFIVDFTQVSMKQVYYCNIVESDDLTDDYQFTTATASDAATPVIHVKEKTTGLANASGSYTATLKAEVRGV